MEIGANSAAIDTDFLIHATSLKKPQDEVIGILSKVFAELGLDVIMHPLVYKNELQTPSATIKAVFDQNLIGVPTMEDILHGDEGKIKFYGILISELYKKLKGLALDTYGKDIFTFWKKQESLGEIHSITMCLICGCGVFLSDDGDSGHLRNIVKNDYIGDITVYDREGLMKKFQTEGTTISRTDRRAFSHKKHC